MSASVRERRLPCGCWGVVSDDRCVIEAEALLCDLRHKQGQLLTFADVANIAISAALSDFDWAAFQAKNADSDHDGLVTDLGVELVANDRFRATLKAICAVPSEHDFHNNAVARAMWEIASRGLDSAS